MKKFWIGILVIALSFCISLPVFAGDVAATHSTDLVFFEKVAGSGAKVQFGVDDDGLDVKFMGETSGAYMLWDESADKLIFDNANISFGDNDYIYFGDGSDGYIYSDGTNMIINASSNTTKVYGEIFSINVRVGTIAAGTDDERPIFVAPFNCQLVSIEVVNASDLAADGTNYTTISFLDKGSDGTGTDVIVSFDTTSTGFTAFDGRDAGTLDATHKLLSDGDVVSFKKADSGTGAAIDEMLIMITYKRR